jgi:hypothetical protein
MEDLFTAARLLKIPKFAKVTTVTTPWTTLFLQPRSGDTGKLGTLVPGSKSGIKSSPGGTALTLLVVAWNGFFPGFLFHGLAVFE